MPTLLSSLSLRAIYIIVAMLVGLVLTLPREGRSTTSRAIRNAAWVAALIPIGWVVLDMDRDDGLYLVPMAYGVTFLFATMLFLFGLSIDPVAAQVCGRCGYDLRGNPGGACPECGHAHGESDSLHL